MSRTSLSVCPGALLVSVLLAVNSATASTIFVDSDASGADDGTTWADAHVDLQDALADAASSGGGVTAIWVAAGTYWPAGPGGAVTATFGLIDGVALVGGLAGNEDPLTFDLDQRDLAAQETVLSGDLDGDDGPGFTDIGDNVYHVTDGSGNDATAIIDGFTITAGAARTGSNPARLGGGMLTRGAGGPTIRNCVFRGNRAEFGGGLYADNLSSPTLENCTFIDNLGAQQAGGMHTFASGPATQIRSCSFINNSSHTGGGLFVRANATVVNCVFTGNEATEVSGFVGEGGGLFTIAVGFGFQMTNCTFSGNAARQGGAVHNSFGGGLNTPSYDNCVLWGNAATTGNEVFNFGSTPTFSFCDIQGSGGSGGGFTPGTDGGGNIDADPLFLDADGADDTVGTADDDLRPALTSPCVDAGDNAPAIAAGATEDRNGASRFADIASVPDSGAGSAPIIDIGAYEAVVSDGDGDGLNDDTELDIAMGSGCPSPVDPDSDDDTLLDGEEALVIGTDPCSEDTDGDGVRDDVDDLPLQPGVTSGFLEDAVRDLATAILALDLSLFNGPNDKANKGRRNALANRANGAAKAIAEDHIDSAISKLTSLLAKIDGQSPPPDWMHPSPEKSDLAAETLLLVTLLELL